MVNVKKHEQTIIISDAENFATAQIDLYGDIRVYFNLMENDHGYIDNHKILIEIDALEDQELYEMLMPLFIDQVSFSLSSENPFQKSRDNEMPSTVTFSQDEERISIIFSKGFAKSAKDIDLDELPKTIFDEETGEAIVPREYCLLFGDNIYLNETSANVERMLELYYYLTEYLKNKASGMKAKRKINKEAIDEN